MLMKSASHPFSHMQAHSGTFGRFLKICASKGAFFCSLREPDCAKSLEERKKQLSFFLLPEFLNTFAVPNRKDGRCVVTLQ